MANTTTFKDNNFGRFKNQWAGFFFNRESIPCHGLQASFLIENQYIAMVILLRRCRSYCGGGPPIKQILGVR